MLQFPLPADVGARVLAHALIRVRLLGGPGSGNFGHAGRPGEVGGSGSLTSVRVSELPNHRVHIDSDQGFITLLRTDDPDPAYGGQQVFVGDIEVKEDLRRQGYGRALYEKALDYALSKGARGLVSSGVLSPDAERMWAKFAAEGRVTQSIDGHKMLVPAPKALGGPGSGNFGHAGRPGEVGGSSEAVRTFTSEEGYAWHEKGAVPEWAKTLPEADRQVLDSYASFGYGDMNRRLRGTYTPRIIDEYLRPATPEEIARYDHQTPEVRQQFGISFGKYPSDYHPDDPTNKTDEGGRIVHNVFYTDPSGNKVEWSVQRPGPDLNYQEELDRKISHIDDTIRNRGYVLPETMEVNRAAYLPGVTEGDLAATVGEVREEKAFTSTMVGDAEKRLTGYASIAKDESLYTRYGGNKAQIDAHQNEPGVSVRMHIELPAGMKVAPIEAVRRTKWKEEWATNDKGVHAPTGRIVYDDQDLSNKEYRSESEVLIGSGAQFKVVRLERGEVHPYTQRQIHDLYLRYVGGGSSEAAS